MLRIIFFILIELCLMRSSMSQQNSPKANYRWDLQVTNPEFELINHKLSKKQFRPYLKKTSWRCEVGETEEKNNLEIRSLTCDYSIKKAGIVKTRVSCSSQRPYSEANLELFDEKKLLTFKIMLTCNKERL